MSTNIAADNIFLAENFTFRQLLDESEKVATEVFEISSFTSRSLDQDPVFLKTCRMFPWAKEQLEETLRNDNLPTLADRVAPLTAITDLYFLSLCAKDIKKNVFPIKQAEILQQSAFWDKYNAKGLKYGLIPVCAGVALSAISFVALATELAPVEQIAIATTVTMAGGMFSTVVAFLVTGTFPDKASETHNNRQDAICYLESRFQDLGERLIDMYFSEAHSSLAYSIATQLLGEEKQKTILDSEANLYKIASRQGLIHDEIVRIFKTLDCAIEYITKNKVLRNASFEAQIEKNRKRYLKKHKKEFQFYLPPSLSEVAIDIKN